jgi:D-sedoheptulose 7-phosphate isomerase
MLDLAPLGVATVTASTRAKTACSSAVDYMADLARVLKLVPGEAVGQAVSLLLEAREMGKRVYVMGNGGSSATASHFVCDLVKTARVAGLDPVRAFALTDNTPLLTAWANDSAYEHSFAAQVSALVDPGDVVIGISASGNSPNILAGFVAAAQGGARTIGLVGFGGGKARDLVDVAIHVDSYDYGLVEDTHSALTHAMATALREALQAEAQVAQLGAQFVTGRRPLLSESRRLGAPLAED